MCDQGETTNLNQDKWKEEKGEAKQSVWND